MHRLTSYFKQAYPITFSWRSTFWNAAGFGLFIAVFLFVFRPFGTYAMATDGAVINALSFGGVTSLGIILCALIARLVPGAFEEATWNLAHELAWGAFNFLVITLLNYALVWLMYGEQVQFTLAGTLIVTLVVGFFPYSMLLLLNHARMLHRNLKDAQVMNAQIVLSDLPDHADPIVIRGENEGEEVVIPQGDLLCLRSASNYCEIHYASGEKAHKKLFRLSLSSAEDQLMGHVHFMRTHRTCILNLSKVTQVDGNAQGYQVTLDGMTETLPVSRANGESFKRRIAP